jgi:Nitroreductase
MAVNKNNVLETIKSRRSIRKYQNEQIKQEELNIILEAGIYAPTGHNDQPWHFTVIQDKELIEYMNIETKKNMVNAPIDWLKNMGKNEKLHIYHSAPTVIVFSGRKNALAPLMDCSAAAQNMLLSAKSLNIGSCWVGLAKFFFQNPENAEKLDLASFFQTTIKDMYIPENASKLNIPQGYEPYFAVTLGYSESTKDIPAPKRERDVVDYIK